MARGRGRAGDIDEGGGAGAGRGHAPVERRPSSLDPRGAAPEDDGEEGDETVLDLRLSHHGPRPAPPTSRPSPPAANGGRVEARPKKKAMFDDIPSETNVDPIDDDEDDDDATEFLARPAAAVRASREVSSPSLVARGRAVPLEEPAPATTAPVPERGLLADRTEPLPSTQRRAMPLDAKAPAREAQPADPLPRPTPRPLPRRSGTVPPPSMTQTGSMPAIQKLQLPLERTGDGPPRAPEPRPLPPPVAEPTPPRGDPRRGARESSPAAAPVEGSGRARAARMLDDDRAEARHESRPERARPPRERAPREDDPRDTLEIDDGSVDSDGWLQVEVPGDATTFLNGVDRGRGPLKIEGIDRFARHSLRVHCPGFLAWSGTVCLEGKPSARIKPQLKERRR